MSKEELLKYLIAEIDLIMHDKDYRFENQDGTWYSRESCRDLTNEEVFEELKLELTQLNSQVEQIADLETKLEITEKALELACETYWNDCGMEDCPADIIDNFIDTYDKCKTCPNGGDRFINDKGCCWVDYFKHKAKEMMKSE